MIPSSPEVILASASRRRYELLKTIGISPRVVVPDTEEKRRRGEGAEEFLHRICRGKNHRAYHPSMYTSLVISADTVVCLGELIIGKPRDRGEAFSILERLSGKKHQVKTGLFLRYKNRELFRRESTDVFFAPLTREEIHRYLDRAHYRDKAGAYAIQEHAALFVERIRGCYHNVVGFPLRLFYRMTRELDLNII